MFLIATAVMIAAISPQAHAKKLDLLPRYNEVRATESSQVQTKESIVTVDGKKYKEVQYKSQFYYFKLYDQENEIADESKCQSAHQLPQEDSIRLVRAEVRTATRSSLYIESLRLKCKRVSSFDPEVGFEIQNKDKSELSVFGGSSHDINSLAPSAGLRFKNKNGDQKEVKVSPSGIGVGTTW